MARATKAPNRLLVPHTITIRNKKHLPESWPLPHWQGTMGCIPAWQGVPGRTARSSLPCSSATKLTLLCGFCVFCLKGSEILYNCPNGTATGTGVLHAQDSAQWACHAAVLRSIRHLQHHIKHSDKTRRSKALRRAPFDGAEHGTATSVHGSAVKSHLGPWLLTP
jgi:hypothetical protein